MIWLVKEIVWWSIVATVIIPISAGMAAVAYCVEKLYQSHPEFVG